MARDQRNCTGSPQLIPTYLLRVDRSWQTRTKGLKNGLAAHQALVVAVDSGPSGYPAAGASTAASTRTRSGTGPAVCMAGVGVDLVKRQHC